MDIETLANHIRNLSKVEFDKVCRLVIEKCFHKTAVNVDGTNDGGTDFATLGESGKRSTVAYQLTVQKAKFDDNFYKDIKKAIDKLGVTQFYYLTSNSVSETIARCWENDMENRLLVTCHVFGCKVIADLLIQNNVANELLEDTSARIPKDLNLDKVEYRERTLHSYTLLSNDARDMREGIYDDTILITLSDYDNGLPKEEIVNKVMMLLSLTERREEVLNSRIDSLIAREKLRKNKSTGYIELTEDTKQDIVGRQKLYDADLASMVSAQTDLMHENGVDWTVEDSRKISVWLAGNFIGKQISFLKDAKAQYLLHPMFKISKERNGCLSKVVSFLRKEKHINVDKAKVIADGLQQLASTDPLIQKITRASMYLALEGSNPMARSKVLGVKQWNECRIMVDASVAMPCICHALYNNYDYGRAADSIRSIHKAKEFGIQPCITYFYIKECAGHLLSALHYLDLDFPPEEMQYSSNAFVAHYYGMKLKNIKVPATLEAFLNSFSIQLKSHYQDNKTHARALMTDIQSLLKDEGVFFEGVKRYETTSCDVYHPYMNVVDKRESKKSSYLINHDTWALQHVSDATYKRGEHWIFLTYDRTLREYGSDNDVSLMICKPAFFLEFVECTQELQESSLENMVHLIASASESTLSIGARMIDKILEYANGDMQNYEFKEDFKRYKSEALKNSSYKGLKTSEEIEKVAKDLVQKFLTQKGIEINDIETEDDEVDFQNAQM